MYFIGLVSYKKQSKPKKNMLVMVGGTPCQLRCDEYQLLNRSLLTNVIITVSVIEIKHCSAAVGKLNLTRNQLLQLFLSE